MSEEAALRIAHFNTYLGGGAAVAARRLHGSLVAAGVESRFYHYSGRSPDPTYQALGPVPGRGVASYLANQVVLQFNQRWDRIRLHGQPEWVELFTFPRSSCRLRWSDLPVAPDVVHLHWIAGFLDLPTWFASIPRDVPVIWTMHDMNPVTGGCHYAGICRGFERDCGNCPQLARPGNDDFSRRNLDLKCDLLASRNVHLVADSVWLEREARASRAFGNVCSTRTIHYGLDHRVFRPRGRRESRDALGIAHDTFVIAFGAESVSNRRKGLVELLAALRKIDSPNVMLLTFGRDRLPDGASGLQTMQVGLVASEDRLANVYSAADLFVLPSLEEAFGQTALEAMACGTPVVGFDVGGVPDMVTPMQTGLLAEPGNAIDLADKIGFMISHPEEARRMGAAARQRVEHRFTLQHQAQAYIELYTDLVR